VNAKREANFAGNESNRMRSAKGANETRVALGQPFIDCLSNHGHAAGNIALSERDPEMGEGIGDTVDSDRCDHCESA
jgi:hypothetical protein